MLLGELATSPNSAHSKNSSRMASPRYTMRPLYTFMVLLASSSLCFWYTSGIMSPMNALDPACLAASEILLQETGLSRSQTGTACRRSRSFCNAC